MRNKDLKHVPKLLRLLAIIIILDLLIQFIFKIDVLVVIYGAALGWYGMGYYQEKEENDELRNNQR